MVVLEDSSMLGTDEEKEKENAREGYTVKQGSEEELN